MSESFKMIRSGPARHSRLGGARILAVLALLPLAACGSNGVKEELKALETAGLKQADFAESEPGPLKAKACQSGTVEQIPALLCEYSSTESVAEGQGGAETWIGDSVTGVVFKRDRYLLALSDKHQIDPSGRTLTNIGRAFRHQTPTASK